MLYFCAAQLLSLNRRAHTCTPRPRVHSEAHTLLLPVHVHGSASVYLHILLLIPPKSIHSVPTYGLKNKQHHWKSDRDSRRGSKRTSLTLSRPTLHAGKVIKLSLGEPEIEVWGVNHLPELEHHMCLSVLSSHPHLDPCGYVSVSWQIWTHTHSKADLKWREHTNIILRASLCTTLWLKESLTDYNCITHQLAKPSKQTESQFTARGSTSIVHLQTGDQRSLMPTHEVIDLLFHAFTRSSWTVYNNSAKLKKKLLICLLVSKKKYTICKLNKQFE